MRSGYVLERGYPLGQTLYQYGFRFRVEELFLDSKSGIFGLTDSRLRDPQQLNRLYLVVAIAILYSTIMGTTVDGLDITDTQTIQKLIDGFEKLDRDGMYEEFCHVIIYVLKQYLRS